jgi:hypothetical protein
MIKPDLINVWPRDVFHSAFAKRINRDRNLFDKVITVISSGSPRHDYVPEITSSIVDAIVFEPDLQHLTAGGKDWRDVCVNLALEKSTAEYILFVEQDLFVEDGFFEKLFALGEDFDAVGFTDGNRLHPACLLVKRSALDKTTKDFGAYPVEDDHFARVTKELMALGNWKTLQELGLTGWYHLAGLTYNISLDEQDILVQYKPEEYKLYKLLAQLL